MGLFKTRIGYLEPEPETKNETKWNRRRGNENNDEIGTKRTNDEKKRSDIKWQRQRVGLLNESVLRAKQSAEQNDVKSFAEGRIAT